MSNHEFRQYDFEKPSLLFRIGDVLVYYIGRRFIYGTYIQSLDLQGSENIIDFGCGGGAAARCLAEELGRDGLITCIDTSSYQIQKAKKRLQHYDTIEFKQGEITGIDIPDGIYDKVSIVYVLHDIKPEKRQQIINSLAAKLTPTGSLHIMEPTKKSHGMSITEIRTLMQNSGLQEKESTVKKNSFMGEFKPA